jgi:hypothetical protein
MRGRQAWGGLWSAATSRRYAFPADRRLACRSSTHVRPGGLPGVRNLAPREAKAVNPHRTPKAETPRARPLFLPLRASSPHPAGATDPSRRTPEKGGNGPFFLSTCPIGQMDGNRAGMCAREKKLVTIFFLLSDWLTIPCGIHQRRKSSMIAKKGRSVRDHVEGPIFARVALGRGSRHWAGAVRRPA